MDLNHSGTRLVFSGTLLKLVTINVEDGKIVDEHPEETMLFDVKFDQSDNIWYVCNDMEFKRYNYHTKKETFSHKDEKGSADTVKEINNMIQIDDTRGHVYCRVSNTKIVEFTCASNSMVDEFDNLTEEKDSSGQDMFIYFFKVFFLIKYKRLQKEEFFTLKAEDNMSNCTIWTQRSLYR